MKATCNIDGRVKLEEFKRIINKLQTILNDARVSNNSHKKLLSVFKMKVSGTDVTGSDASSSYERFCAEFMRDERVGLSNQDNGAQLYVIPPALSTCLPLFEILKETETSKFKEQFLYGVITSKEPGPDKYVNAPGKLIIFSFEPNWNINYC